MYPGVIPTTKSLGNPLICHVSQPDFACPKRGKRKKKQFRAFLLGILSDCFKNISIVRILIQAIFWSFQIRIVSLFKFELRDPQAERGGRKSCHALTPAQGLERGRDGGEEKVMTVTRA